jgi:hypothetical protein
MCLGEEPSDSPVPTEILSKAVTDNHLQYNEMFLWYNSLAIKPKKIIYLI